MFYDADPSILLKRKIAIIGYGSQGHAHALNLKDSGANVTVGLYDGSPSWSRARADGLTVVTTSEACSHADLVVMLMPDTSQRQVYEAEVSPNLGKGDALFFAHGFNVHYGQITPPPNVDVCMIAPKGPGHLLRRTYVEGKGIPALAAVHQDASGRALELTLSYAHALGSLRAGVIQTTFAEETETDLFGEQAVLCGGVTELVRAGFETLVAAGYQPEIAYFECLHELKLIVDLMYEGGLSWMRYSISDTAEYGDYSRGKRVIDAGTRNRMSEILDEIRDGSFAQEWIAENDAGRPEFSANRAAAQMQLIEEAGAKLRSMMPWLDSKRVPLEASAR